MQRIAAVAAAAGLAGGLLLAAPLAPVTAAQPWALATTGGTCPAESGSTACVQLMVTSVPYASSDHAWASAALSGPAGPVTITAYGLTSETNEFTYGSSGGDTAIWKVRASAMPAGDYTLSAVFHAGISSDTHTWTFRWPAPGTPTQAPSTGSGSTATFATCAALRKTYPGGIAKTANAKNKVTVKGKKKVRPFKKAPHISPPLYAANKSLDPDHDKIACER